MSCGFGCLPVKRPSQWLLSYIISIPHYPPIVKIDALDYAIAGILLVCTVDDDMHLVAFYSCTLSGA
jgi:hypothetical protein